MSGFGLARRPDTLACGARRLVSTLFSITLLGCAGGGARARAASDADPATNRFFFRHSNNTVRKRAHNWKSNLARDRRPQAIRNRSGRRDCDALACFERSIPIVGQLRFDAVDLDVRPQRFSGD